VSLLMVHRAELHRELLRALPDGAVRTGVTVTRVDPGAAARPARVEHADADGTDSATDCNLVVAADGLRSRIRQALWPDAPGPATPGSRPGGA
jgi:2-polyprenyl-6-methoxyphenol hydroxylase-like FAD-dependent oxidoreductase